MANTFVRTHIRVRDLEIPTSSSVVKGARSSSKRPVIGIWKASASRNEHHLRHHPINLLYHVHRKNFSLVHEYLTPASDPNSADRKHRFSGAGAGAGAGAHVLERGEIGWLALSRRTEIDVMNKIKSVSSGAAGAVGANRSHGCCARLVQSAILCVTSICCNPSRDTKSAHSFVSLLELPCHLAVIQDFPSASRQGTEFELSSMRQISSSLPP